jgi:hypothetical protein
MMNTARRSMGERASKWKTYRCSKYSASDQIINPRATSASAQGVGPHIIPASMMAGSNTAHSTANAVNEITVNRSNRELRNSVIRL